MQRELDLSQAQLFLDDSGLDETNYVSRQWHQPRKFPEPILKPEHPWERWNPTMYGTALHWNGKFRMWYVPFGSNINHVGPLPKRNPRSGVCYAESEDGVEWTKPFLGLHFFEGGKENNIVLEAAADQRYIDNVSIIDDAGDEEWPLKALYWEAATHDWSKSDWGIYAARSKDGVHWDTCPGLILPQWIDRFNAVSTKVEGKYLVYGRAIDVERTMGRNGRSVWRTESEDLLHWSEPELVLQRDPDDPLYLQYYSLSAFPYESLMLGGLERMYMVPDRLDTELVWSQDGGRAWKRAPMRPAFLEPGTFSENSRRWDDTWVNLPTNAPFRHQGHLWFYYTGRSTAHHWPYPTNYGAIGLSLLRTDGFASLHAAEVEGQVVTKPLTWPGGDLCVNADPRRHLSSHPGFCSGEVRVELRDETNRPLPGFTWDVVVPITGNTRTDENCRAAVQWRDGKSARDLAGRRLRIAFKLRDAHLYSFCARQ